MNLLTLNILLVLFLVLLVGCETPARNSTKDTLEATVVNRSKAELVSRVKLDTSRFTVLKFNAKGDYIFKNTQPASLSADEIQQIERLLVRCITEFNSVQQDEFDKQVKAFPEIPWRKDNYIVDLPRYKRQFIAVMNKRGEKEVWVNCFCGEETYWRREAVIIDDGGNCYFNVKINLSRGLYYDLEVNGNA